MHQHAPAAAKHAYEQQLCSTRNSSKGSTTGSSNKAQLHQQQPSMPISNISAAQEPAPTGEETQRQFCLGFVQRALHFA